MSFTSDLKVVTDLPVATLEGTSSGEKTSLKPDHAPTFATYLYFAAEQRKNYSLDGVENNEKEIEGEKGTNSDFGGGEVIEDSDDVKEGIRARRSLRTASWFAVFWLITADMIGPGQAPQVFSSLGFGGASLSFTFMGGAALYCSTLLWQLYMGLDSDRYPIRTYGDLALRIMGPRARQVVNVLLCFQLLMCVAVIVLINGNGLSQILADRQLCYSALMIVWPVFGILLGSIKSMRNFTSAANMGVLLYMIIVCITMGVVTRSEPNYGGTIRDDSHVLPLPVITQMFSAAGELGPRVVAVMMVVMSYAGSMVFCEFLSEMRRPADFFKSLIAAQGLTYVVYLVYGSVVYSAQGQYTMNPANQGISNYAFQTATNVLCSIAMLVSAALYGNIGIKSCMTVIRDFTGHEFDENNSWRGRVMWQIATSIYWSVAWAIASAVPHLFSIAGFIGAVALMQFTYTFPLLLHVTYQLQYDAVLSHPSYDSSIAYPAPLPDNWRNLSWWKRAWRRHWYVKAINLLLFLASAATAIWGIVAALEEMIGSFKTSNTSPFGCASPVA